MKQKQCLKCGKAKLVAEFSFKNKAKVIRQARCKECTRAAIREHYKRNREYYLAKTKKRNKFLRKQITDFLVHYLKKHPCVDCGEGNIIVLEFDHIEKKSNDISRMLKNRLSLKTIQFEVEKCQVRCANCYRKRTATIGKWYRTTIEELNGPVAQR